MKTTNSVILSETKNLIQSMGYETLHSVQGDTFRTFARASKDKENIREVLPAGTDPNPHVDRLIATIGLPISGIKVYRGKEVIQEIQFPMDKIRGT